MTPHPAPAGATAAGCWLVLHDLHDTGALPLADALRPEAARRGLQVQALSVPALMAWGRWRLRVDGRGSASRLVLPALSLAAGEPVVAAEPDAPSAPVPAPAWRLAGVVQRAGPVWLPAALPEADYKAAEWQALLVAWLHGLPCPVVNRPRCDAMDLATRSPARWRQAAAAGGLPVAALQPSSPGGPPAPVGAPDLLVVGGACCALAGAPLPPALAAAAIRGAQAAGCALLAWRGLTDRTGTWRVTGADPAPDLRPFGPGAVQALAAALAAPAPATASSPRPEAAWA